MKRLYIAYGSNLHKEQMAFRCPDATPVCTTTLHDYRLVFQGASYGAHANVIPEKGQEVPVAIWEISARDEAMLDRYEGVRGGYYTREFMQVEINGKMREALIYIMTPHDFGIPSDSYLYTIAQGYEDFNLDARVLNEAAIHANEHTKVSRRFNYNFYN